MNLNRRQLLALSSTTAAGTLAAWLPGAAHAQDKWPSKPITYIVAFPAGGTSDVLARLITQKLGPALGTTVVVDNKAGSGGSVGSELASRAPADGYTMLGGTISSHAINVSLYPKLGYDPTTSFTPVTLIGTNPVVLVVKADSPYKTLQDVIAAAKAGKPLSAASAGNGTSQHLALELLKFRAGVPGITHIPYKGSAPAIQDVMGGQVDMMFDTTVVAAPHIESGRLRALAVSSAQRLASMAAVPTVAETLANFEVVSWQAIFVPAGTPAAVVNRLHTEIAKILAEADMQDRLNKLGMLPSTMSPEQVATFQKAEVVKWAQVIKTANIRLE